MDINNRRMIETEVRPRATLEDCKAWVQANANSLVWQKFREWKDRLRLPANPKTVEAGCGYGKFSMLLGLSGAQVTLLDYSATCLESAVEAHRLIGLSPRGVQGDILALPADLEGAFDVVCSFGTLEHFSGKFRLAAFQANARLLRPGGMLFFVVPNRFGIFYRIAMGMRRILGLFPDDFYEAPFSRSELMRLAAASGVTALEVECVGTLRNDLEYWIGENAKSLFRKVFRKKRAPACGRAMDIVIRNIDLAAHVRDARCTLDRRFSAGWLFVGQKDGG
ncbi:MAG: class I SAM-dependent methyltransferase [Lentisphaerae bacterium]|nr:class I SAM-dependent methyltransferase [Lentisphaerota bacterium]